MNHLRHILVVMNLLELVEEVAHIEAEMNILVEEVVLDMLSYGFTTNN